MWWLILSGIFHNFNMYAINSFNTPFLMRFHGMTLREASVTSSIAVGAVGPSACSPAVMLPIGWARSAAQRARRWPRGP